jgi:SAM-dependent methyltransferase
MFSPLEVFQNAVMAIRPIARLAQRRHSTGLNADPEEAKKVFQLYTKFSPVEGKDILEIGPGHTLEVLELAIDANAKSCTAVDVIGYVPSARARSIPISYQVYDGRRLPFEPGRFDLVWSYTAFEHLRYPVLTVQECFRVLRPGGMLVSLIDLGDHSYYGMDRPHPEKLFHCLQYPEWLWNIMRWNRSSYVNRLRQSDWLHLLQSAGFKIEAVETAVSEETVRLLPSLKYLTRYSYEDAVTSVLTVCCGKS